MIGRVIHMLELIARLGTMGAALALLLLFLLGMAEILARLMLTSSTGIAVEYGGYLLALSLMLGLGGAVVDGRHIRFSPAERLPPPVASGVDLAATFTALAIAAFLASAMIDQAIGSLFIDARSFFPSATPLLFPQLMLAFGPILLVVGLLARLLRLIFGQAVSG